MDQCKTAKMKVDVIFCVLVYKNGSDLLDFIKSVKDNCFFSYKIIVVNSYFDEATKKEIENISTQNGCVFLNRENKGYGFGNNQGIAYSVNHFDFSFLIVANPDVIVNHFDYQDLKPYENETVVFGPTIACNGRRNQNPAYYRHSSLSEYLVYLGLRKNWKFVFYQGIAINAFIRVFCPKNKNCDIYGCHGSFVGFSRKGIDKLSPVFDEQIFMFFEELDLAHKIDSLSIRCLFIPSIHVFHKEDGSIKLGNLNVSKITKKSVLYIYKKWHKHQGGY
jgi:GT2 family glycosyltransferase